MYDSYFPAQDIYHLLSLTQASYYGFSAGGNFSHSSGSKNSKSKYDESKKSLKIEGAQIIGWVCTVVPHFPTIDAKNDY